jgi:hypothetical protein
MAWGVRRKIAAGYWLLVAGQKEESGKREGGRGKREEDVLGCFLSSSS